MLCHMPALRLCLVIFCFLVLGVDGLSVVVGAGMAGLSAARELVRNDMPVLVLEAQNHYGGRIHSREFGGFVLNTGANWVHGIGKSPQTGDENPIWSVAKSIELKGNITDYNDVTVFNSQGDVIDSEHWTLLSDNFKNIWDKVIDYTERLDGELESNWQLSIEDEFQSFGLYDQYPSPADLNLTSLISWKWVDYDTAQSPSQSSLMGAYPDPTKDDWGDYGADFLVTGDYGDVVNTFVQEIGEEKIQLQSVVKEIGYDETGVRVILDDNEVIYGDQVIVTVSAAVRQTDAIIFSPKLPETQLDALSRFDGIAYYAKLYLQFPEQFWPNTTYFHYVTENERGEYGSFLNLNHPDFLPNSYIICMELTDRYAHELEQEDLEISVDRVMALLKKLFGDDIPLPTNFWKTDWSNDPYFLMSYSNFPVGFTDNDYEQMCASVDDMIFFGGEACEIDYFGYTHGAYFSGVAVANEILSQSEKKRNNALYIALGVFALLTLIAIVWYFSRHVRAPGPKFAVLPDRSDSDDAGGIQMDEMDPLAGRTSTQTPSETAYAIQVT